ncbi:protein toll-like [Argopecten irradians]|uniref:protein toll-like n=1 Tax=Argopecten irradians TaxID=31199 RepID=UPI00371FD9AF
MCFNRIVLLLLIMAPLCSSYIDWSPEVGPHKDLLCRPFCTDDRCCSCHSQPKWELGNEPIGDLHVEYSGLGKVSAKLVSVSNLSEYNYLQVIHTHGRLRALPINICNFERLVKINFANNLIESIGTINCLQMLDTLVLSGNRISHISNKTFVDMPALRVLDLSYNILTTLDANTFTSKTTNIFHVDFSNNVLETVDLSNIVNENYLYCKIDFENAMKGHFSNVHNITIDPDKHYNSGDISFVGCIMEQDMFSFIGHRNPDLIQLFPLIISGTYKFANATVKCDCSVALYLKDHWRLLKLDDNNDGLMCRDQNYSIRDMHDQKLFDNFFCDRYVNCPRYCTCIEQPTQWRIIVNCSFTQMKRLPEQLPDSVFLVELLVTNNEIRHLEKRDYFNRLRILDLSDNEMKTIGNDVAQSLSSLLKLNLTNHNIDDLPDTFRFLDANLIFLGYKGITCTCDNTWIGDWRVRSNIHPGNPLFCENIRNHGNKTLVELTKPYLVECSEMDQSTIFLLTALLCLAVLSMTGIFVIWMFYFEVSILLGTIRRKTIKEDLRRYKYDVFVSFDDSDVDSRRFVMDYLLRILNSSHYTTYVPYRDMSVGNLREKEVKNAIRRARTFVCILSEEYCAESSIWTRMEFMSALQCRKSIEIINIDNIGTRDTSMREVKAFLRLRWFISLSTRRDIFKHLIDSLGKPIYMGRKNM